MNKEKYQPTPEEIKKAEEMMTPEQRVASSKREILEKWKKERKEKYQERKEQKEILFRKFVAEVRKDPDFQQYLEERGISLDPSREGREGIRDATPILIEKLALFLSQNQRKGENIFLTYEEIQGYAPERKYSIRLWDHDPIPNRGGHYDWDKVTGWAEYATSNKKDFDEIIWRLRQRLFRDVTEENLVSDWIDEESGEGYPRHPSEMAYPIQHVRHLFRGEKIEYPNKKVRFSDPRRIEIFPAKYDVQKPLLEQQTLAVLKDIRENNNSREVREDSALGEIINKIETGTRF